MADAIIKFFLKSNPMDAKIIVKHKPSNRKRLYDGSLTYNELNRFVKAFAWIIVPVYGTIGNDLRTNIQSMIYDLRTFGFNALEDVVIKESKGKAVPVPLFGLNELDTRGITYKNIIMDIVHDVEAEEIARKLTLEQFHLSEQIKTMPIDELINKLI